MYKMNITPLFPSNLVVTNLDSKFNTIDLKNVNFVSTNSMGQSLVSSDVSDSLFVINDYPELAFEIIKIFQQYTTDILKLSNKFIISTSWFTRMKPGDTCKFHQHHNCFYSGLYYFDDYEENSGDISLLDPLRPFNNFLIAPDNQEDWNIYNSTEWKIKPKKDTIIFFPSYVEHAILDNTSNKSRHSLAFNFIPIGKYGLSDSSYNTDWFKN